MKLEDIFGQNKERDLEICKLYMDEGLSMEDIASKVGLCYTRVHQILYVNRGVIKADTNWEKAKRINTLKKIAKNAGLTLSDKKDILNVLEQLRKEIEGDKPLIQNTENHITYVWEDSQDSVQSSRLPEGSA